MRFPVHPVNNINVFQSFIIVLRDNLHGSKDIEFMIINASDTYLNDVKYDNQF